MKPAQQPSTERVSLLAAGSVLSGDFATTGELVILGQLDGGQVVSPIITIGPAAHVTANLLANTIRIEGVVVGDVHAKHSVVIHASATVQGNIQSPQLKIHDGATVDGVIRYLPATSEAPNNEQSHAAPLRSARRAR